MLQVLAVLASCIRELKVNKEKFTNPGPKDDMEIVMEEFEMNIITALYLCTIVTKIFKMEAVTVSCDDRKQANKLVYILNKMNLKLRDGQTLLHLAVNGVTPVDDFHTSDVCRFPCVDTVKLLLECGASVSVMDCSRNSPLHTLTATVNARTKWINHPINSNARVSSFSHILPLHFKQLQSFRASNPHFDIDNIDEITSIFIAAGIHMDAVNIEGLTAAQICASRKCILDYPASWLCP